MDLRSDRVRVVGSVTRLMDVSRGEEDSVVCR